MRDHEIEELVSYLSYDHLPPALQAISEPFHKVGVLMAYKLLQENDSYALKLGLEKLVEAKDCFVRAALNAKP